MAFSVAFLAQLRWKKLSEWMRDRWESLLYRGVIWAILWLNPLLQLFIWLPLHTSSVTQFADYPAYYAAARAVAAGQSPYLILSDWGPERTPFMYLYPPPFAASLSPFGRIHAAQFIEIWYSMLLVAHWVFAWSLASLWQEMTYARCEKTSLQPSPRRWFRPPLWSILGCGLVLYSVPGYRAQLSYGNAQVLVNALWGLSLLGGSGSIRRGISLVVAAWWKLHPLWALILFLVHERRTRAAAALSLALYGGFGAWVCGIHAYADWWRAASGVVNQGTFNADNWSASFAVLRLAHWLGLWNHQSGQLPEPLRMFLSLVAVAAPVATLWLTRKFSLRLRGAMAVSVAVWCAPLCWSGYSAMWIPTLLLWWGERNIVTECDPTKV